MNDEGRTELETGNSNANTEGRPQARRKGDDIAERLLALGAAVVKLLEALSQRPGAKNLVRQLERYGPAGAANDEEARGAESPADFIHKVRIALKEVRETRYWLRLVLQAELLEDAHHLASLIVEAGELITILTASANRTPPKRATSVMPAILRSFSKRGVELHEHQRPSRTDADPDGTPRSAASTPNRPPLSARSCAGAPAPRKRAKRPSSS